MAATTAASATTARVVPDTADKFCGTLWSRKNMAATHFLLRCCGDWSASFRYQRRRATRSGAVKTFAADQCERHWHARRVELLVLVRGSY